MNFHVELQIIGSEECPEGVTATALIERCYIGYIGMFCWMLIK